MDGDGTTPYPTIASALPSVGGTAEICVEKYSATAGTLPMAPCRGGTYTENVQVYNRSIVVYPDPALELINEGVCIDGATGTTNPVFDFDQSPGSSVSGFEHVFNSYGYEVFKITNSEVELSDIQSASSYARGGGVVVEVGTGGVVWIWNVQMNDSLIGLRQTYNAQAEVYWSSIIGMGQVGAVLGGFSATSTIEDTTFVMNQKIATITGNHTSSWNNNQIYGNDDSISVEDSATLTMHNNLVKENALPSQTAVLEFFDWSQGTITNSTFAFNDGYSEISWLHGSTVDVVDSLFVDDSTSDSDSGLHCGVGSAGGGTGHYTHHFRMSQGHSPQVLLIPGDPFSGYVWACTADSNVSNVDPLFYPVGGYYYLDQTTSPLIDAGSASASTVYDFGEADWTTDSSGTTDEGTVVDIGYHFRSGL